MIRRLAANIPYILITRTKMYNWACHLWLRLQKYWELSSDESKLAFCWATTCLLFFEIYKVTHWCARSVAFSKRAAYNGPRLVFQRWNLTVSYRKGTSVCHLRTRRETLSGEQWKLYQYPAKTNSIIKKRKTLTYTVHEFLKSLY